MPIKRYQQLYVSIQVIFIRFFQHFITIMLILVDFQPSAHVDIKNHDQNTFRASTLLNGVYDGQLCARGNGQGGISYFKRVFNGN